MKVINRKKVRRRRGDDWKLSKKEIESIVIGNGQIKRGETIRVDNIEKYLALI